MGIFDNRLFHAGLDELLVTQNQALGPFVDFDPHGDIFSSYSGTTGSTALSCVYNLENPFVNNYQLDYPAWHDNEVVGSAPSIGIAVALTPRHVVTGEHGREQVGTSLVWAKRNLTGDVAETVVRTCIDAVYSVQGDEFGGWWTSPLVDGLPTYELRILYLDEDLPSDLVAPILFPPDVPVSRFPGERNTLGGYPVMILDRLTRRARIANLDPDEGGGDLYSFIRMTWPLEAPQIVTNPPSQHELRAKFYDNNSFHSGSPVFFCYDQSQLIYIGVILEQSASFTGRATTARGPSTILFHNGIIAGVKELNRRHAAAEGVPNYMPTYFKPASVRGIYRPPPSGPLG